MSEPHLDVEPLGDVLRWLAEVDVESMDDAARIDLLRAAEETKAALAACQARATIAFDASQRRRDATRGVQPGAHGTAVGAQVALALRCSAAKGRRFVGFAKALPEMPAVRAALAAGQTTEYRAQLAVRETAHLSRDDRAAVDAQLAARPGGIEHLGDVATEHACRAAADRLDPAGAVRRRSRAVAGRRVSLRPAPDGMTRLSGLLPLTDGVAVWATLHQAADTARATGDGRARGQVMADELVARVTGHDAGTAASVEVSLTMSATALFGDDTTAGPAQTQEPALVEGYGPIPADLARGLVREADKVWLRRLFTHPGHGDLVAMDSRRRLFGGALRRFLVIRDQTCRTPWCDAPIRHADHVVPVAEGGRTSARNGQGLCEACNYAKSSGHLTQQVTAAGSVDTVTATRHRYRSRRPRPPGAASRLDLSHCEAAVADLALGA